MNGPSQPDSPQPPAGAITVDRRLAWGLASAATMALGSVGTWISIGPMSISGTAGSGDGWITLAIGVVLAVLVAVRRLPWLVLPGALLAAGIGIGDAIRILGTEGNEWFSISLGWGLILVIVASVSLVAWGATALSVVPSRQRTVAGVATVIALAGAVAIGLVDRDSSDPSDQADTTLQDTAESGDDNAEPADWDTSTEGEEASGADSGLDDAPTESSTDSTATEDEDASAARKAVSIGVAATDDDVTFKVGAFDRVSSIATHEYADGPIVPAEGSKLYVATVTWKNNMTSSASIFCGGGSTVLVDQKGRNFDPDSDAMLGIPENDFCDQLQPGFKQTVKLVFRTPKDAKPYSLVLWNNDAEDDFTGDASYVAVALGD